MTCEDLVRRIQTIQPDADAREVARIFLLATNCVDDLSELEDDANLRDVWQRVGLQLHGATDQHAAMTAELEELAESDPRKFSAEQIWVLIRAIKVQSQVLQLYLGEQALDV
ncbi:MAG: hypothetical protein MI757_19395 [Pirellulales bacterium]|nr:hypothetical protein [Pirellulales bacterium]